jgi:hypothetical protein
MSGALSARIETLNRSRIRARSRISSVMSTSPKKKPVRSQAEPPAAVVDEILMKQIIALGMAGETQFAISKKLGLSRPMVDKICDDPKFREMAMEIGNREVVPVIAKMRSQLSKLGEAAISVVKQHLQENNLEAAKLVFKTMGLMEQEEKQGDTQLTVILPGSHSTHDVASDTIVIGDKDAV